MCGILVSFQRNSCIISADLLCHGERNGCVIWDVIFNILVIYGGAAQTGWDNGLAITNLELLKKDLEDGIIGSDGDHQTPTEYVLTRVSDVDTSSSGALSKGLTYAGVP